MPEAPKPFAKDGKRAKRAPSALIAIASFCLGAGIVGGICAARGEGIIESVFWASLSGSAAAVLSRIVGRFARAKFSESGAKRASGR